MGICYTQALPVLSSVADSLAVTVSALHYAGTGHLLLGHSPQALHNPETSPITAALEVMSRFATDPKWIIYLPPTMSPCETARSGDCLESPAQAFSHYRSAGVPTVVCEEKHMGSRAVVIVCKNEETTRTRFGIMGDGAGVIYTRTGRRFFDERRLEEELILNKNKSHEI